MITTFIFIGIAAIVVGWLMSAYYASRLLMLRKEYERLPQKWEEVKANLIHRRFYARGIILIGLVVLIICLLID